MFLSRVFQAEIKKVERTRRTPTKSPGRVKKDPGFSTPEKSGFPIPPTHYTPNKEKPDLTPIKGQEPLLVLTDISKSDIEVVQGIKFDLSSFKENSNSPLNPKHRIIEKVEDPQDPPDSPDPGLIHELDAWFNQCNMDLLDEAGEDSENTTDLDYTKYRESLARRNLENSSNARWVENPFAMQSGVNGDEDEYISVSSVYDEDSNSNLDPSSRFFKHAYHEVDQDTSEDYNPYKENRRGSYKPKKGKPVTGFPEGVKLKKAQVKIGKVLQNGGRPKRGRPKKYADDFDFSVDDEDYSPSGGNVKKEIFNTGDHAMTTEQKLELCRYTEKYGKKESAEFHSEQWDMKITERCAEYCFLKYSTLKEIHGREPTVEEYDYKHKWSTEDKVIIAKYGMEHGPTEAARHFSKVYKVYLNESNARSHMGFYRRKYLE